MTSPLPPHSSKSALTESKGSSKADFMDFCAPKKKADTPSFESLISKNEDRHDRQDELEKAEASKKRRKQVDAAAVAAQATNDSPLQATPNLEELPVLVQRQEISTSKVGTSLGNDISSNGSESPESETASEQSNVADLNSVASKTNSGEVTNQNLNGLEVEAPESEKSAIAVNQPKSQEKVEDSQTAVLDHANSEVVSEKNLDGVQFEASHSESSKSGAPLPKHHEIVDDSETAGLDHSNYDVALKKNLDGVQFEASHSQSSKSGASPLKSHEKVGDSEADGQESLAVQDIFQKKSAENISSELELKSTPDGTKTAVSLNSMFSLSTFEEIQTSSAPKSANEPSITSVNRLSVISAFSENSATHPTENADSGSDASPEHFLSANPALAQAQFGVASHKPASAQAASVFKTLSTEVEKFHQSGQSQVQLELSVSDTESVKIRLSLRAGQIHSTFITESPELRDALQKAWPDFSATHRTQGIRFGESQFQDSFTRNQDAASEQGRQRQSQSSVFGEELASKPHSKAPARLASSPLTGRISSSSVNLWA